MTETHQMLIGGELVDAADGRTFDTLDPSTGEVYGHVARAGAEDARRAVQAARKAFDEGPWPRMRGRERAGYLLKVADLAKEYGFTDVDGKQQSLFWDKHWAGTWGTAPDE